MRTLRGHGFPVTRWALAAAVLIGLAAGALALPEEVDAAPVARGVLQPIPSPTPEIPSVDPNRQLGRQVHVPILSFLGHDACSTWIEVQAVGCEFSKAILIAWGEAGFCPPQAAGPLKVECTGLLKPGSTWNLLGDQVPSGAKSGMLFKFSARQLSEYGLDRVFGFDDIFADLMCETLFFGVVGDADDYRRFKKAYNEGGTFSGIPQDIAAGEGYLAVEVLRDCPSTVTAGARITSKYDGIAGDHLGRWDPVYGGYAFYVPAVYASREGFNTWIYIQNGGLECSSVEVWFKTQDDCLRATICEVLTLAPGETYQLDASTCVGPDWLGSAWVRASQPMGVAVDVVGRDVLMTYVGEPAEINYTFDPERASFTAGNQVAFGPLIYSEYQGWDTGIQVQNLSPVVASKVKVYFLDRSGDVITTLVDWICPRGSQTFFLPVVYSLPGAWVGSVRVESQEWITPGGPNVLPPNIVAVAMMVKYNDVQRTQTQEAMAYNLLPEHKVFDWQIGGRGSGGLMSGVGLVAIPSLIKDIGGTGVTTELAITNVVPKPGFTDFAIYLFDQNGLLDYICQKLNEKQVEYIDLQRWGYINNGFKGSAIISATFWEHDVFGPDGRFNRNLVGLAGVVVERSKTILGVDIPGDEAAATRGIPFALGDFELCPFGFTGGFAPSCPGVPEFGGDPNDCPETLVVSCHNCPVTLLDGGTTTTRLGVNIPIGCVIEDVDLRLDIEHPNVGDLTVQLGRTDSPTGLVTYRPLFASICGTGNDIKAVLDDEATPTIGSVCPPSAFQRYRTQSGRTLKSFYHIPARGEWSLRIDDNTAGNAGRIRGFSLEFELTR